MTVASSSMRVVYLMSLPLPLLSVKLGLSTRFEVNSTSGLEMTVEFLSQAMIGEGLDYGKNEQCEAPGNEKTFPFKAEEVTKPFQEGKPISFMRWGDGDFYCALNMGVGGDSNGVNLNNKEMCSELRSNLMDYGSTPNSDNLWPIAGTWWFCKERNGAIHRAVKEFFEKNLTQANWRGFGNGWSAGGFYFPLVPEKQSGRARGVVPILQGRKVALVGPDHLNKLDSMLGHTDYISVPHSGCWEARETIKKQVRDVSSRNPKESVVFLVAGGVAARPLIYDLYKEIGQKDSFIDVGASLDGFAGVSSRDFNSNINRFCDDYPEYVAPGACGGKSSILQTNFMAKRSSEHASPVGAENVFYGL